MTHRLGTPVHARLFVVVRKRISEHEAHVLAVLPGLCVEPVLELVLNGAEVHGLLDNVKVVWAVECHGVDRVPKRARIGLLPHLLVQRHEVVQQLILLPLFRLGDHAVSGCARVLRAARLLQPVDALCKLLKVVLLAVCLHEGRFLNARGELQDALLRLGAGGGRCTLPVGTTEE